MAKFTPIAASIILLCALWPLCGRAATADEIGKFRSELEALKSDYNSKVQALEARIKQLESAATAAQTPQSAVAGPDFGAVPSAVTPVVASPSGKFGNATAFNPAISMILAGNYASLSQDPASYRIAGFIPPPGGTGPGLRSFNLGESELTISSNVDPYFYANVTASIHGDNSISVEEAYFKTLALNNGFTIKGGRFFSGVGYLNEIHSHNWDFVDQPLVYQIFLGGQLGQDGAQVRWLAPTDVFFELGAEAGSGRSFPGTQRNRNSLASSVLFGHAGGDIGDSTSWRLGVSWLDDRATDRSYDDVDQFGTSVVNQFSGTSRTLIIDGTLKWAPHGDPTQHLFKLQGEYMRRSERGQLAFDVLGPNLADAYDSSQSGWYLQGVYGFMPRWRMGLRYDSLHSGTARIGLVGSGLLSPKDFVTLRSSSPDRTTFMLDWSLSEFSRLRAQFAWDQARARDTDRQIRLQYIFAIGAHGAHKY